MVTARKHWGARQRPTVVDVLKPREVQGPPAIRIRLDQIDPSPRNPRRSLEVDDLAASIAAYGLLQPVVVRENGPRYELVAGHRRFAALRQLADRHPDEPRWREIEAVLRRADGDEAFLLTLTENLQREDLHPKEEAGALEVLVRQEGWSVRRVAEVIHRDPLYVSRRLRVFDDPVLAGPVLSKRMPVSTAEVFVRVEDPQERAALVERAVAEGWSQTQARRALSERRGVTPRSADELLTHLRAAHALISRLSVDDAPGPVAAEIRRLALAVASGVGAGNAPRRTPKAADRRKEATQATAGR